MVKINLRDTSTSNTKKEVDNSLDFTSFSKENVTKNKNLVTKKIKLKDLVPFEENVRRVYNQDELESLKKSILMDTDMDNIDVFFIEDKDYYLIADWHRTRRAYLQLMDEYPDKFPEDYEVEVIVRKRVPTLNTDVEMELIWWGINSSDTKINLRPVELLISYLNYLSKLDKIEPEKAPHKLSQKDVYSKFPWLNENTAMKYSKVLQSIPEKVLLELDPETTSFRSLYEISKEWNEDKKEVMLNLVQSWELDNSIEIKQIIEAWNTEGEEVNSLSIEKEHRDRSLDSLESIEKGVEKLQSDVKKKVLEAKQDMGRIKNVKQIEWTIKLLSQIWESNEEKDDNTSKEIYLNKIKDLIKAVSTQWYNIDSSVTIYFIDSLIEMIEKLDREALTTVNAYNFDTKTKKLLELLSKL